MEKERAGLPKTTWKGSERNRIEDALRLMAGFLDLREELSGATSGSCVYVNSKENKQENHTANKNQP